jgi:hypothetical protein
VHSHPEPRPRNVVRELLAVLASAKGTIKGDRRTAGSNAFAPIPLNRRLCAFERSVAYELV